jgi:hypothetical protein
MKRQRASIYASLQKETNIDCKVMQVGKFADLDDGLKIHCHERGGGQGASGISKWKQNLEYRAQHGYRAPARGAGPLAADRTIRSA